MAWFWIIITLCVSSFCSSEAQGGDFVFEKGFLYQDGLEIPTVQFSNTTVQGIPKEANGKLYIDAFLGIRYAEPPVGDLRFRNPVPYVYRDVKFLGVERKPRCLHMVDKVKGGEDCLNLNVYRPKSIGNQSLPVMVYFQGADPVPSSQTAIPEIGSYYLLDKDIVLVTLTYRLGVFGFLSTGDDQVPGNFGLKDQKVALQWVQSNIAAFGGDPSRVTLFGNGHAAECIHYHTLVNHTEGLFQQYILQSGTALGPGSVCDRKTHANLTQQLADVVGCPIIPTSEMVDCLRKVDSNSLLTSSLRLFTKMDEALLKTWTLTTEPDGPGAFLTECPADVFARNQQRNLPFIAGVVRHEAPSAVYAALQHGRGDDVFQKPIRALRGLVETILGFPDLVERVNQFYFEGVLYNLTSFESEENKKHQFYRMDLDYCYHLTLFLLDLLNDIHYYHPTVRVLEQQRQNSIYPSYFYYFDFQGICTLGRWYGNMIGGGAHGDELLYLFPYDPTECPEVESYDSFKERDVITAVTMVELWTSFAIQGVPQASRVENWIPYDSEGHYLEIGSGRDPTITVKSNFHSERMRFWGNTTLQICD